MILSFFENELKLHVLINLRNKQQLCLLMGISHKMKNTFFSARLVSSWTRISTYNFIESVWNGIIAKSRTGFNTKLYKGDV